MVDSDLSNREKLSAVRDIAKYRPWLTVFIIFISFCAALLEGIGLSFLIPIIELAQAESTDPESLSGIAQYFADLYLYLGAPFTLEFVIIGVSAVMAIRYGLSFSVAWLREILRTNYIRDLRKDAFDNALQTRIAYFDSQGSDEILNSIITETNYAGRAIRQIVAVVEQSLLATMYLAIALYLAPWLTIFTICILGGIMYVIRASVESGYSIGDRVADANEKVQETVQFGTQGIRDVRLFDMTAEVYSRFTDAVNQYANAAITLRRNRAAINNSYQFITAVSVFVLIYVALKIASLSFGSMGVFLFAMYRLAPRVSNINQMIYDIEGNLPHFVRVQEFMDEMSMNAEPDTGTAQSPNPVEPIEFHDVTFSYDDDDRILNDLSFEVNQGEFVAFVGQSGAGKSTIVSLLARMYEPDDGRISANGTPIDTIGLREWRSKLAVVRQNPFIFNDTLRFNLTIGNRDVSDEELDRVCRIARVDEFRDDLANGYETVLGDEGVQLSGGQRQRVALARALLEDADVLVLDEATSDLDSNLEEQIQKRIEEMNREYTIIAIAHRLSTVTNADCIYTIDSGQVIEKGTHDELVNQDGKYAELYAIQS